MTRILIEPGRELLSNSATFARTRRDRVRGLIGRPPLSGDQALVFQKTKQIHTFGMSYALDVIFCDRRLEVLHVTHNMPPRRLSRWVFRSQYIIEMRAGAVPPDLAGGTRLLLCEAAVSDGGAGAASPTHG